MAQKYSDSTLKQVRAGHFLYWQEQRYRVLPGDEESPLTLRVENVTTLERQTIRMEELLGSSEGVSTFAPTLEDLQTEIDRHCPSPTEPNWYALPVHLQQKADRIIAVVETVDRLIEAEKGRALLRQETFQRTPAVRRACAQLDEPVSKTTYYKYRALYRRHKGDRAAIAAALRRATFNQTKLDQVQLHFVDTHIMRFYARSSSIRPRPSTLYKITQSAFERTNGLWPDPERCPGQIPEDLIEELLDPNLPLSAILDNPEKASLLTAIKLPSRSWFYQYLRWFEHQPEYGKTIMIARHGQEMWEREQLVF